MKADLHRYLQVGRDALLWKLEGLSEYDCRRPMTPTGTNLLGLVKHVASVEAGYLGDISVARSANHFLGSTKAQNRTRTCGRRPTSHARTSSSLYRRVWANSDATIEALELDTVGRVPWWPEDRNEVTLHRLLLHMIAETHRHAGHADIVRETIDGSAGLRADNDNLAEGDAAWWADYRERLETAAHQAGG